jgi:hypothetical protein
MRTAAQRIAAYNARMQSSQIDPTLTAMEALAQANYTSYVNEFYPFQVALRNWLDSQDIHGALVFQFEAFNNEMYSAWRRFQGTALISMATVLVDKYEDYGMTRADLITVCLDVWSVIVPGP